MGNFDASLRFGHSTEWYLRAAARGVVAEMMPEVLYYRRLHHGNRSRLMSAASREELLHLVKAHLDRCRRTDGSGKPLAATRKPDADV